MNEKRNGAKGIPLLRFFTILRKSGCTYKKSRTLSVKGPLNENMQTEKRRRRK